MTQIFSAKAETKNVIFQQRSSDNDEFLGSQPKSSSFYPVMTLFVTAATAAAGADHFLLWPTSNLNNVTRFAF